MRKQAARRWAAAVSAVVGVVGGGVAIAAATTPTGGCAVSYAVTSQWSGGFVAHVQVTNFGDPVPSWEVAWAFSAGQRVVQAWGASVAQSGGAVTATNASWNGALGQGASASLGFVGTLPGADNPVPGTFTFNGVTCNGAGSTTPTPTATSSATATTGASATATATSATTPSATATTTAATTAASTSSPTGTDCATQAGSSPTSRITEVNVGTSVVSFGAQGDTDQLPTAIAPNPSGGSWLAWLSTDNKVHLGKLDCDDKLVGTAAVVDGIDLQDVKADADGVVVLLTRPGPQGSGTLCGGTSSPTKTMWMVRFDNSGKQVWERQVTNLSSTRGGYDPGALFVWWYNHHGTLAYDGTNYAAYFEVAITVANGNCVDIHEGDRMQVVNATTGAAVSGHDSFNWGCSHAWDSHIVWDDRTGHYAMVCATDNNCRIAQPNPYRTVVSGACDGTLFGGDIVLASSQGYWTAWSNGNQVRLEHFTTGATDKTVMTADKTQHSHLVGYGSGRMLLTWKSGSSTAAQVYDAGTGATIGTQFAVNVPDNTYVSTKEYADGSVAFPAAGTSSSTIRIVRVMPLA